MKHLKRVSVARADNGGSITPVEQAILLLLTLFFNDWTNFYPVIENVQKLYRKT